MLGRMLARFPAPLHRSVLQSQHALNPAVSITLPIRTYATPGRPKSVVGEPSRPVKRNVKKAAAKPRDGSTAAEKKVAAKKRSPRQNNSEQGAIQAEMVKAQREKLATKKASTRAAAAKLKIEELKKIALDPPKAKATSSPFITFYAERSKGSGLSPSQTSEMTKAAGVEWKNISAADREHYNHLTHTRNSEQQAIFKSWVKSHTPEQIQQANEARAQLRRKYPASKLKWAKIEDERAPKRPANVFALFNSNRQSSGDFKGIKLSDASKLIAQEWKALDSSEKEKYDRIHKDDLQRYISEYSSVFGHAPKVAQTSATAA